MLCCSFAESFKLLNHEDHEETKLHNEELTEKWKQKTELITDLDARVKK